MRKKTALILVLCSAFLTFNLNALYVSVPPMIYSPSTHGNGGV